MRWINWIEGLSIAFNQIDVAVQNLDNAVALVSAGLGEETQLDTTATPATATLFRNVLTSSIGLLQGEAS